MLAYSAVSLCDMISVPAKGGKKNIKPQPVPAADKEAFAKLTDIADALIVLGFTNIYDIPYDALDSILSTWEYKGQDGQIYGPFQGDQIVKWMKQGLFGGDAGVEMRKVVRSKVSSSDEPSSKRIRFEETKSEKPASNHADLLNDLEDDSDSDPEATAMMGRRPASTPVSRPTVVAAASENGPWVNSSSVDFGDTDFNDVKDENEEDAMY